MKIRVSLVLTQCFLLLFAILANTSTVEKYGQPKELQWNRYVTDNFEILSLDNPQGKYLCDNIEFIKTWISLRWGLRDLDFPTIQDKDGNSLRVKCRVICVPSVDFYEKLFNRKTPVWRLELKNGVPEYSVWFISDGQKWNTKLPVFLTETILVNFEANTGTRLPLWCHRGMSVLNGRIEDIRAKLTLVGSFDSKLTLTMAQDSYDKLSEGQRLSFDAQAAFFCLWVKQEFGEKAFLDYLTGSITNSEYYLQYFGVKTYSDCDIKVRSYVGKLVNSPDHYFTW
jgi:hypothetical protein